MNFLAHLYLSGNDENILVGNFIGDHVKGTDFSKYHEGIISGIKLHRMIDAFTDSHPVVEESKKRLRPHFHKYAPVITDVFYDHFLAKNFLNHHTIPLIEFAEKSYFILSMHENIFPERTQRMFHFMKKENWLISYETMEGVNKALTGMSRRTKFASGMENATAHLEKDYLLYKKEFEVFIEELKSYCDARINLIIS